MSNRVLDDKRTKDVTVENNEPDSHDIEIVNSMPKSGEGYYYLLSKEKRKNVIPFSSVDIEYFDILDVEDKTAFICMSRVQRDEHINYLRSADSYENNTSTKTDETRMTRKQGKSLIGQLTKNLRSLVKEKNKNGMSKQVGKSDVFTKESLIKLQDNMRTLCIEEFNEEYNLNNSLKKKTKR